MSRYFLEISYKGTHYSGFQVQQNTERTIQAEVEKAFSILQRDTVTLTGSSRTDAGVHALQNFFHFDYADEIHPQFIYKMNAILPSDIVLKNLVAVKGDAHCRFDAVSREYRYYIYRRKDPFLEDRAFYFPYRLNMEQLKIAAGIIRQYHDFTSFSKRNTQVKRFTCNIIESEWLLEDDCLVYYVKSDRFLRGMVRALTATMLKIGREKMDIDELRRVIEAKDCTKASFSVPATGLFLVSVNFPGDYFS
ncbi:MAG: tRNA pseudouridine(38-40) synthase TruA [Bacteroidetes bacterium]|jgi:tRNA pseudouridine38-40 synthase|nr:MAG: tRNA pseudouridine(38-40) synthase TruA [Bacteroidota bacterium]